MELRHLRYFVKSAELLHFTRAAKALHVSQSSLSVQIQQLERELGTRLFERSERRVHLTKAGELFLSYARRALGEIEAGEQGIQDLNGLLRGTLRIGVTYSFSAEMFPGMLAEFLRRYPAITVFANVATNSGVEEGVRMKNLDLGLVSQSAQAADFDFRELFKQEIMVVISRKHPLANLKDIRIRDLRNVRLALPTSAFMTRQLIDAAFAAENILPDVILETNDIDILMGLAKRGVAATLVSAQAAVHLNSNEVSKLRLKEEGLFLTAAFIWARTGRITSAANRFVELAADYLGAAPTHHPQNSKDPAIATND